MDGIERKSTGRRHMSHSAWVAEGTQLFGPDTLHWRFVCPGCKHVASVADYKAAGAPETVVGYLSVGRYLPADKCRDWMGGTGPGPCNYAGGGLFQIHPVEVEFNGATQPVFDFDRAPAPVPAAVC